MHRLVLIENVPRQIGQKTAPPVRHWRRSHSVDTGADRIEPNPERLDRFGRCVRRNLAGIILTVGQHNQDAAL